MVILGEHTPARLNTWTRCLQDSLKRLFLKRGYALIVRLSHNFQALVGAVEYRC